MNATAKFYRENNQNFSSKNVKIAGTTLSTVNNYTLYILELRMRKNVASIRLHSCIKNKKYKLLSLLTIAVYAHIRITQKKVR